MAENDEKEYSTKSIIKNSQFFSYGYPYSR